MSTLLLDKTGTITFGNRQAAELLAVAGVDAGRAGRRRPAASLADETPEGRSIVVLAKTAHGLRERAAGRAQRTPTSSPFTAQTRMSGVDLDGGAADPQGRRRGGDEVGPRQRRPPRRRGRRARGRHLHRRRHPAGGRRELGRPGRALGVVHLKDVVKPGMRSGSPSCAGWASAP